MAMNRTLWKMEKNYEITEKTKFILKGELVMESARSETLSYKELTHSSGSLNTGRFEKMK